MIHTATSDVRRILLMDDEPIIRDVTTAMLEKSGFTVFKTATGDEAVTAFRAVRDIGLSFHVVLLDLHATSGMGGVETLQALKVMDPFVKAVLVSGDKSDPVFKDFKAHGFCGALAKPFGVRDLLDSIHCVGYPRAKDGLLKPNHPAVSSRR